MTASAVLGYVFATVCVLSSLYVALSKDLLRVTMAFFLELACVSGVLLTLEADYLALIVFSVALMGTILVISFSSVIMGSLKDGFVESARPRAARFLGMALGLSLGVVLGWLFMTPRLREVDQTIAAPPVPAPGGINAIGRMMLGEQLVALELLALIVLIVVVGAGLLLRKPHDAN